MSKRKTVSTTKKHGEEGNYENQKLFTSVNYKWMGIGLAFIILGFVLMAGGKSPDPNVFDENAVYGFQRITLAPILLILGLLIEVYAIMKTNKK